MTGEREEYCFEEWAITQKHGGRFRELKTGKKIASETMGISRHVVEDLYWQRDPVLQVDMPK